MNAKLTKFITASLASLFLLGFSPTAAVQAYNTVPVIPRVDFTSDGVFWSKLGTHTGVAPSGTVEELRQFYEKGQPALLYFSKKPLSQDHNQDQWNKLLEFKAETQKKRLYKDFETIHEFRESLRGHLDAVVKQVMDSVPASPLVPSQGRADQILAKHAAMNPKPVVNVVKKQLKDLVTELSLDFETEKAIKPEKTDNGKRILARASDKLFELSKSEDPSLTPEIKKEFKDCIVNIKQMQQHQVYLDGGKSYNQFWEYGEQILADIANAADMVE